jgi:glycosyltransferase involved in cell wall biosynthesis
MNIAFFLDGPILPISTGAAERFVNLLRFQNTDGFSTFLFKCYRDWTDDVELFKKEMFTTYFLQPNDYFNNIQLLFNLLSLNNIEFCYFANPETLLTIGLELKQLGFTIIYDSHDIYSVIDKRLGLSQEKQDISNFTQFVSSSYADIIYTCSETDKHHLVDLSVNEEKIHVLPNSTNTSAIKYNLPDIKKKNILFVGHNFYQPNLNAVKILRSQIYPSPLLANFRFNICGLTPQQDINELKSKRFIFHGFVDNLDSFYLNSTIAVAPIFEGSGTRVKILQYLAAGIPTITTTIGCEGLDLKNGNEIIICDEIESYPQLITKITSEFDIYNNLSKNGRRAIEDRYDWSKNCQKSIQKLKTVKNRAT